ncbi:hypothetical protein CHS0354_021089 [Potamilus streckersoni]|uniref:chitin synthase n=1 Tax=Potamilus streckersoni TaxID=2493646 RepID=A0AAE0SD74_9BIVA|nr:hypothetical protein CHS0354_021089 [Potamilus streckersoni]
MKLPNIEHDTKYGGLTLTMLGYARLQSDETAPDTKPDLPMVNRMIPLPVHDEGRVLIAKEKDTRNSMADGGVVNPAFEAVDKLQGSGNTWSDTSSENNKEDTLSSRTGRRGNDYTDNPMKRVPGATHLNTESKDLKMPPTEKDKTSTMKSWDVFRVVPRGKEKAADDEYYNVFRKIVKVFVGIFLTVIVLLTTIFSKSALLLITSNVYNNVTLQCERLSEKDVTKCVRVPPDQPVTNKYIFSQEVVVRWLWALLMVVCTPYLFTFIKCFWRMCFKKTRNPTVKVLLPVVMVETMHTTGICIFSFYVLPSMDPIRGLMLTFGIGLLPSILKMFDKQSEDGKKWYIVLLDTAAVLAQLSVLVLWPVRNIIKKENYEEAWTIPVSIILISIGWWENYVNRFTGLGAFGTKLKAFKHNVRRMRTKLYIITSLWKVVLTIALMSILMSGGKMSCMRILYYIDSSAKDCPHLVHDSLKHDRVWSTNYYADPFWVALMQIFSCLLCYQCAKTACKIMLQVVSFSLPLMLAAPLMAGLFIEDCEAWKTTNLKSGLMPEYMYWTCDIHGVSRGFMNTLIMEYYIPVCIAWWLSFMWVTFHIWLPRVERLVQTERLFVQPLYCGVMLEQSLILNRRRDDKDRENRSSEKRKHYSGLDYLKGPYPTELPLTSRVKVRREETPMIYVCATMWHETEKEMIQILTSLFRLDNDQCARRNAQRFFDVVDPDYYEFEAHVFFDDAFDAHNDDEYEYHVNSFVKQLVLVMDKAASKVHRVPVKIGPPTKYPTPYGGRLEWSLLGGNKLVAHLKDKVKIRHKKRWSQVMYMYYLLGHKLVSQPLDARRKQVLADNTFILALDGDVDFKPSAVQLLVDRMKKNEKVGAACGRIHPIGMGPMIWYQKFEYAVSHWLQKSTEHMIGCVLCSPGCFSLFRASALMDDNVMGKYASVSTSAKHYVQYDQGEDRWLCTLLLQQGYRVEYCAAADALTYAPEGFREFYNQRRRWSPSTMANIMDLLGDWRNIIKINENFSFLYMVYQLLLFASSLVTPATIFLLITGSINAAFPALDLIDSLIINSVPVAIFLAACFFLSSEWQLNLPIS